MRGMLVGWMLVAPKNACGEIVGVANESGDVDVVTGEVRRCVKEIKEVDAPEDDAWLEWDRERWKGGGVRTLSLKCGALREPSGVPQVYRAVRLSPCRDRSSSRRHQGECPGGCSGQGAG